MAGDNVQTPEVATHGRTRWTLAQRIVLALLVVVALAVGFVGRHLLRIEAATKSVVYQTRDRAATMSYMPLKPHLVTLSIGPTYRTGQPLEWECTEEGVQSWLLAMPKPTDPEELLAESVSFRLPYEGEEQSSPDARWGWHASSPEGLVAYYPDAPLRHRWNIEHTLSRACRHENRFCESWNAVAAQTAAQEAEQLEGRD